MVKIGTCFEGKMQNGDAIGWYERAGRTYPFNSHPYSLLGHVCYNLGKYDLAIKYCEQAIELQTIWKNNSLRDLSDSYLYKGLVLTQTGFALISDKDAFGKFGEAIECYNNSIRVNSTNDSAHTADIWGSKGITFGYMSQKSDTNVDTFRLLQECRDCCNKSIEANSNSSFTWICKGEYNFTLGKIYSDAYTNNHYQNSNYGKKSNYYYGLALRCYEKALEINEKQKNWDSNVWLREADIILMLKYGNYTLSNAASKKAGEIIDSFRPRESFDEGQYWIEGPVSINPAGENYRIEGPVKIRPAGENSSSSSLR